MSSPVPSPAALQAALKRWHVPTKYHLGWKSRGRPASTGTFGPLIGTVNHHTADKGSVGAASIRAIVAMLIRGRSDLPGPLCHFTPDRLGIVHVIALGRANHAGAFAANVIQAVQRGVVPPHPGTVDSVDGNSRFWGIENENDGTGEDYPDAQVESLVRLNAALAELGGWSSNASIQHREGTRRKTDMSNIDGHPSGDFLRAQVALALSVGPERYGYPTVKPVAKPQFQDTRPVVMLGAIQRAWKGKTGRGAFRGVRAVQRGLHRAGFLNGYVPGVAGSKTKAAYTRWATKVDGGRAYRAPSKRQVQVLAGPGYRVR